MRDEKRSGLARALSKMGYCSRSRAAQIVRAGRVALNGRIVRDPEAPVHIEKDRVTVDGKPIEKRDKVYLVMNKPRGVVTTASDEGGRSTVYDFLDKSGEWVAPVGRLDKASEGLLLLTNDSEWAAKITDPVSHVDKRYHVQVDCIADQNLLEQLRRGVEAGSEHFAAKAARIVRLGGKNCWLEITLDEGKNRQIRRLLAALGLEVLRLVRVSIGTLELGDLKKGAVRPLTAAEKKTLDEELLRRSLQLRRPRPG